MVLSLYGDFVNLALSASSVKEVECSLEEPVLLLLVWHVSESYNVEWDLFGVCRLAFNELLVMFHYFILDTVLKEQFFLLWVGRELVRVQVDVSFCSLDLDLKQKGVFFYTISAIEAETSRGFAIKG